MTPERVNKRIAEILGWTDVHGGEADGGLYLRGIPPWATNGLHEVVPNFFGSLDACVKFEATLGPKDFETYRWILWGLCKRPTVTEWQRAYLTAQATLRCEAFLLRLDGKREDSEQ